jgi:hypothetical protein
MIKVFQKYGAQPLWIRLTVLTYALCLGGATYNHVMDLVRGGFLPYTNTPLPFNVYWTSLTFFDSLAILLLFVFPRWGILTTVMIMVTDIAVNTYSTYHFWDLTIGTNVFLQLQILFGVFVFITSPLMLRRLT